MAVNEPIDPRVRLAISQWPDDAPRGAVSTFCAEHGISRKSFYELRKRAKTDGPAAVLEPRTRRPRSSPSKLSEEVKEQAVQVRAALEQSGLDHGPISVHDKMRAMGLAQVPSTASLARIFREAGVARLEPKKKPRSAVAAVRLPGPERVLATRATEYVLTGGRKCVIFQLIDDHSRYAVASHVASGETAEAAIAVVDKAMAAHGVPQRLLSDNGLALNPSRRGHIGQLVAHVSAPGRRGDHRQALQADHPGQERTLPPDPVPLPRQAATRRDARLNCRPRSTRSTTSTTPSVPTKGCPGASPLTAWEATPKADPPRPKPDRPIYHRVPSRYRRPRPQPPADLPAGTRFRTVSTAGTIGLDYVHYKVDVDLTFEQVLVVNTGDQTGDTIIITDLHGEVLAEYTRPAPGIRYLGNGRRPDRQEPATVTDVLMQNCHRCPGT